MLIFGKFFGSWRFAFDTISYALYVELIWKEHNSILHGNGAVDVESMIRSVRNSLAVYSQAALQDTEALNSFTNRWTLVPPPWMKINVDMAEVLCTTPTFGEASAILLGVKVAAANGWKLIVIESDCKDLIDKWDLKKEMIGNQVHL
ncbi:hypothetical protein TorRG33x02_132950 [Trema orientale]|uniref:RNase H type-1 domain-containing protein n=1 Tax=Trema orientale TaxID=63057 RepID=A0A2P5EZC3_TREOI|nr:hypothetical protein TorRG33x02_132950 [Trema orientale]